MSNEFFMSGSVLKSADLKDQNTKRVYEQTATWSFLTSEKQNIMESFSGKRSKELKPPSADDSITSEEP